MADLRTIRTDVVGSLLRPTAVIEARKSFDEGKIGAADLRAIEDDAVRAAVRVAGEHRPRRDQRRRDAPAELPGQFRRGGRRL